MSEVYTSVTGSPEFFTLPSSDECFRDWSYADKIALIQPALDDIAAHRTLPATQVHAQMRQLLQNLPTQS